MPFSTRLTERLGIAVGGDGTLQAETDRVTCVTVSGPARGQGWVVRKLKEMLPRVRNNQLHADLGEMLRSHEANIALANEVSSCGR